MLGCRIVAMEGNGRNLSIFAGYDHHLSLFLHYHGNEDSVEVEGGEEIQGEYSFRLPFSILEEGAQYYAS